MKSVWKYAVVATGAIALLLGLTAQSKQRTEVALLGIRLFSPAVRVLQKFGNPRQITYVSITVQRFDQQQQQQQQTGTGGEMPGPGGPPGFGQPPGTGGTPGEQRVEMETTYIYKGKGGSTYAFVVNKDGRVVQISAHGYKPDPNVRTARGITLGDPYSKVVRAYGYPQEHQYYGDVILARYNKLGVAFQIDTKTNRVMAIAVAAGIPLSGPGFIGTGGGQQPGMPGGGPSPGGLGAPPPAAGGGGAGPKGGGGAMGGPAI